MRVEQLSYSADTSALFSGFADRPWAVWLDSCADRDSSGRFDIFSADPPVRIVTRGDSTRVYAADTVEYLDSEPLTVLMSQLERLDFQASSLPFSGGAIGFLSYDLGKNFERLPSTTVNDEDLPRMAIGLYDWALVVDHQTRETYLVLQGSPARCDELSRQIRTILGAAKESRSFSMTSDIVHDIAPDDYRAAFAQIKQYIEAGDCYQINYAQRFSATYQGSSIAAYLRLRSVNPAPYAAYLNYPFGAVMSSSPELFLASERQRVWSKPIKGTCRRTNTPQDEQNRERLRRSEKDRAENLMIVDLVRNDLSRVCVPGTVKTPGLFDIESYAMVHHLVSTVTGELQADRSGIHALRAAFPGGSITGAPKIRAMEIIDELEAFHRGVYCGSIGYIDCSGDIQFNIAIRTLTCRNGQLKFWAGGGIVYDSTVDGEYQESLDKAAAIVRAFGDNAQ